MIVPPPLLPELDGGRPAASSLGSATATIRLGAQVVAIKGVDALIETAHGRALLQGAPGLRPGMTVVLELQHTDPALPRTGHLVAVGDERLEHAPAGTPAARAFGAGCRDGARCRGARGQRAPGRPRWPVRSTPALIARLSVPPPEPGSASPGSSPALPSGGAAARASVPPATSGPAGPVTPPAMVPPGRRVGWRQGWLAGRAGTGDCGDRLAGRPRQRSSGILAPWRREGRALEAVVLPRDALGRTLLRAAGLTLQVDTPLDLPAGSRLQLSLPAEPAPIGCGAAPSRPA